MGTYKFAPNNNIEYRPTILHTAEITSSELMNGITSGYPTPNIAVLLDNGDVIIGVLAHQTSVELLAAKYFQPALEAAIDGLNDLNDSLSEEFYPDDDDHDDVADDNCDDCGQPMADHKGCTDHVHTDCGCPPRH